MKASMRTVPMESRKLGRAELLASEVLVLVMTLAGLYTEDGTEGGWLYMSEDPEEYSDGTCCWEKVRKAVMPGGAVRGPVELLLRPWNGPRGMLGGSAASGTGLSNCEGA